VVDGLPRTISMCRDRFCEHTNNQLQRNAERVHRLGQPVFEIKSDPLALLRVKIIASYPKDRDPLLSGWLLGGDRLKGKAALVEVGLGKGRIVLFGFRPQYRGQSLATYPLFFNAISVR
jgi:hypothetical protein